MDVNGDTMDIDVNQPVLNIVKKIFVTKTMVPVRLGATEKDMVLYVIKFVVVDVQQGNVNNRVETV